MSTETDVPGTRGTNDDGQLKGCDVLSVQASVGAEAAFNKARKTSDAVRKTLRDVNNMLANMSKCLLVLLKCKRFRGRPLTPSVLRLLPLRPVEY